MAELPQPTMRNGIPGIQFPEEVISSFAEPFKFTLVGKISGRRATVPNQSIHAAFAKLPLFQSFKLRFLPRNFLIITLTNEGDYSRIWSMGGLYVGALAIRFSKWTPEFKPEAESPIAPVWIRFSELPVHLYNKKGLYALAKILGNPIKIDDFTADETRGSFARVCVELNVLQQHPKQIWVGWGEHSQVIDVIFERLPSYCLDCKILGHSTASCYAHGKNPRPPRPASHTPAGLSSEAPHPPPTSPSPTPPPQPDDVPLQPAPTRGRGRGPRRGRGRPRRPATPRASTQEPVPGSQASHNTFDILTSLPTETDITVINPTPHLVLSLPSLSLLTWLKTLLRPLGMTLAEKLPFHGIKLLLLILSKFLPSMTLDFILPLNRLVPWNPLPAFISSANILTPLPQSPLYRYPPPLCPR
ncbi:hypothetical protein F511_43334 [Dorcoceras hygrometricum]|uniref:Uncharacterized protein n=1 Tax=Dorcoceras hygrometricum TaxID=472368 RepID=A0A2Z6ZZD7_9LAMI|nr:hypothetical protein F511_43334 [Dorcoceras hygrometricum]